MNQLDSMSHNVRDEGVGGSNPLTPTNTSYNSGDQSPQPTPQAKREKVKGVRRYQHPVSKIWYCYHRPTKQRVLSEWGSKAFFREVRKLDALVAAVQPRKPRVHVAPKSPKKPVPKTRMTQDGAWQRFYSLTARSIRSRSATREVDVSINGDVLFAMHKAQDAKCAISGIRFDTRVVDGSRLRPWAPSVDRIDCQKGYVEGNIRLTCIAANMARSDWGDEVFQVLVRGLFSKLVRKNNLPRRRHPPRAALTPKP